MKTALTSGCPTVTELIGSINTGALRRTKARGCHLRPTSRLLVIRPQSAARKNTREAGVLFKLVGSRLSARGSHQVKSVTRMLRGSTPPRLHPAVPDA